MNESTGATRSIVIEKEMSHPPEKIWRALTQGSLIEELDTTALLAFAIGSGRVAGRMLPFSST
jgi:hypothetical protein